MTHQSRSESEWQCSSPTYLGGIAGIACLLIAGCQGEVDSSSAALARSPDAHFAQTDDCNADGEPTWQDPVNGIMQNRCVKCHDYCGSYDTVQGVIDNGKLQTFTEREHYISGQDKIDLLRWIEVGAPERECVVPGADCGDGSCSGVETCASCPEDCVVPAGSVCCDEEIVAGDCCLDRDCPTGQVCMYEECVPEPASIGCRAYQNFTSEAVVGLAFLIGLARRRRRSSEIERVKG